MVAARVGLAIGVAFLHFIDHIGIGGAARWLQSCRQREVIFVDHDTAILIVAVVTASISFTALILKVFEVARKK